MKMKASFIFTLMWSFSLALSFAGAIVLVSRSYENYEHQRKGSNVRVIKVDTTAKFPDKEKVILADGFMTVRIAEDSGEYKPECGNVGNCYNCHMK